jgi:lipopolysaccharide biosynthesis protein/glycosyltransferase involved in cell wall biosynthesis
MDMAGTRLQRANEEFRAKNYDKARAFYEEAMAENSDLAELIRFNLRLLDKRLGLSSHQGLGLDARLFYFPEREEKLANQKVCLFVAYCKDDLEKTKLRYLRCIKENGFKVVLVINSDAKDEGRYETKEIKGIADCLIVRKNVGFDFGGWAHAIRLVPEIFSAEMLLFCNDSVVGPSSAFDGMMNDIVHDAADVVALTESHEERKHFQTYFFVAKRRALELMRRTGYWRKIQQFTRKRDVIKDYELGMHQFLIEADMTVKTLFDLDSLNVQHERNPLHFHWRELVGLGFPFVKRELLLKNPYSVDLSMWEDFLVRRKFSHLSVSETYVLGSKGQNFSVSDQLYNYWLLNGSPYFDAAYYLAHNQDLVSCEDLCLHYLINGGGEKRNPSRLFNTSKYLEQFPGAQFCNPLVHYLRFNREVTPPEVNDIPREFIDVVVDQDPIFLDKLALPSAARENKARKALLVHCFYVDILEEILGFGGVGEFDALLVTTSSQEAAKDIEQLLEKAWKAKYKIRIVENRGRDIAPFLNEFLDEYVKYDYVCKVHTKRSPHLFEFGEKWRTYLYHNLFGSKSIVEKQVLLFESDSKVGITYPVPMVGTTNNTWDDNKDIADSLLREVGADVSRLDFESLEYPSATMFWFRPKALGKMLGAFSYSRFPPEPIPIDGTIAHALERVVQFVCEDAGYFGVKTALCSSFVLSGAEAEIANWVDSSSSSNKVLIVTHDASNSGAPRTALGLQRKFIADMGYDCLVVFFNGGVLKERFAAIGPVVDFDGAAPNHELLKLLLHGRTDIKVVTNTVVCAPLIPLFKECGLRIISLIHEFATCGYFPATYFENVFEHADRIVYPGERVLEDTLKVVDDVDTGKVVFLPQGIYKDEFPEGDLSEARRRVRQEVGAPDDAFIFLACGTVEARKGFDIFVELAGRFSSQGDKVHFIWIGGISKAEVEEQLISAAFERVDILNKKRKYVHYLGSKDKPDSYFLGSDAFLLTSRQDPFPGVVLEAMACALPVVCFKEATDVHNAFLDGKGGEAVEEMSLDKFEAAMRRLLAKAGRVRKFGAHNKKRVEENYRFISYAKRIGKLAFDSDELQGPKLSIVVPTYNPKLYFFQQLYASLDMQRYGNWELCIADGGNSPTFKMLLQILANHDSRVKVKLLPNNQGISGNTNEALNMVTGSYVGLLDHDDTLAVDALAEIMTVVSESAADFVYSDEDKTDETGLRYFDPVYKPDFCWDALRVNNFITHFTVIKKSIVDEVGGFRSAYDGAQDYDYFLRVLEKASSVQHLKKTLYHWRISSTSTAGGIAGVKDYAIDAGRKALEDHYKRVGMVGVRVANSDTPGRYIAVNI